MMTEDERDRLLSDLRLYLNIDNSELDTPVGQLVNEKLSRFLSERSEDASEDEIVEMTNLMKDHRRLVDAYRAPSTDTSELLSDDIPPP